MGSHEKDEQLAKITENRRDANKLIKKAARGMGLKLDPDTWCSIGLTSPSCWEEFTETVWKPTSFNNLVPKNEGRPLHQCATKCTWADWFADIPVLDMKKRGKNEKIMVRLEFKVQEVRTVMAMSQFGTDVQNVARKSQWLYFV